MESQRLKGETAIVTGSDSGIGQAIAFAVAKEGADVAVTWLHDKDEAERTKYEIEVTGQRAYLAQLDVRDPSLVASFFGEVQKHLGTPIILVNNARVDAPGKPVKDMSVEPWNNIIRTSLYWPFFTCQQSIGGPDGSGKHGTILHIASVHQKIPCAAGLDVSKGGLRNLTTTPALELAEKTST